MRRIIGIDPGNERSAFAVISYPELKPLQFGKVTNDDLQHYLKEFNFTDDDTVVIEMVACYGMPVGKEVFDTCRFVGRLEEQLSRRGHVPDLLYRREEKLHICHSAKAKDTNIRQALINRFAQHDLKNGKGTKNAHDWFYGFRADIWAAYAVAITYAETRLGGAFLDG